MAGVTDLPFRQLCREMGAGLVVSEMVASDPTTWSTRKSRLRIQFGDEPSPKSVQIAGYDPQMMAEARRQSIRDVKAGTQSKGRTDTQVTASVKATGGARRGSGVEGWGRATVGRSSGGGDGLRGRDGDGDESVT